MSNRFGPLADEGEEMECALRVGSNFRKAPVVDSGASRHFFGRGVSSCVVEVREEEREFLGVERGISRSSKDVTVELPGVETVDGGEETARLDGSFSQVLQVRVFQPANWKHKPGNKGWRVSGKRQSTGLLARESGPTSSREEKGVQVAQEDKRVQEAQDDGRKREKEKKEKEKRVTRLLVDKKVIDVMMAHVNPRKGHIMATEEEVRNGSHDGAIREELKTFQRNEVLKVGGMRVLARRRVIKTRWVLTWKMKGGERVPKARLVCKGFQDDRKNVETYSGTVAWWALLVCFVFASSKGWKVGKSDVHTAFLTAQISDDVFVQLPGRVPEGSPEGFASGEVSQLLCAMYGLKDAPRLYGQHFKRIAGECGWEEVTESVFMKKEAGSMKAVMAVHVDDLLVFPDDPVRDLEPLRKRLEMDEPEILEYGGEMGYTGMEVKRTEQGFALSQKAYLESIPVQKEDLPRKSLSPELIESSAEEETDESLVSVMQKVMGVLGWVCCMTADLAYLFSELSRYNSRPSGSKLVAALLTLIRVREKGDCLQFSGVDNPKLALFVDAAYSFSCCEGRGGFEAYLVDKKESIANMRFSNLVAWKSKRIKRKLISSTSAELCALVDGVKQSFQWKRLAKALCMKPLEVEVYTDSAPLMEQLESGQSRREPRMDSLLAYACQELRALKAKVPWVQTDKQRADRHIKYKMERDRGSQAPKFVQKQMKRDRKVLDFAKACRGKQKNDSLGSSRVRG
uniref:Reverse transcriptase Ty1/copia-type domain-containing protein n=1 Tax=Chromera velia CCMP2878 TaxID=1169474 RepID=A0A0G4I466_9ALVE|eukprot:Cvel_10842.t1-p1 / transcript=Cvel_10842.t1 / gene=Cvel_10842 / organism=Chromera_velia_CCMP2878 / gene_product=Retrovirus-related Pol polyprotein from transposon, putative / transcript_product=Retrovirus-related Pol polyprotein from transposon, putative / location=Cvel_scaffold663:64054-67971(-) / protein_length=740 / sequence_SO=supercontig / SO=protein_coding / is_pseudo=false